MIIKRVLLLLFSSSSHTKEGPSELKNIMKQEQRETRHHLMISRYPKPVVQDIAPVHHRSIVCLFFLSLVVAI